MIYKWIQELVSYGYDAGLVADEDVVYVINRLCEKLGLDHYEGSFELLSNGTEYIEVLENITNYAFEKGLITSPNPPFSDLFETGLMDLMMPRPSEIIESFWRFYRNDPELATDYYYRLSKASHYIRMDRVIKNMFWQVESDYGEIDITVNLSKPEKDPKAIALGQKQVESGYPKCLLCYENVGYQGHVNHPARQNHRVISLALRDEQWYLQYSPYVYFNEHSIVFKKEHTPMIISRATYERLLEFVDLFPHYFIGSNADLPIVGGSMLSHDHYQSGRTVFPMERASTYKTYKLNDYQGVTVKWLKWPLTVLRLKASSRTEILECADYITKKWRQYSDSTNNIIGFTEDIPHNTVTPIVRKKENDYEVDIVLRNNKTTEAYPDGIFHPHPDVHPVKKENIGLIEVMGLAILPSRLKVQMALLEEALEDSWSLEKVGEHEEIKLFGNLYTTMEENYKTLGNAETAIRKVIGKTFIKGLEDAGIYKLDEVGCQGLERFIQHLNK